MSALREQPYVPGLIKHARSVVKPGTVQMVTVLHDHDCPKLRGGRCTCQPEIELLNRAQRRARRSKRGGT